MAEWDAEAKIDFLLEPDMRELLAALCGDVRDDLALSSSPALRGFTAPRRATLLEQRKLRRKALRKCPRAMEMLFTPLGLEQLTHWELARHKVSRLPPGLASLADLCCGLGGDSFYLPPSLNVVGLDRSKAALKAYRHNVSLFHPARTALGDAERPPLKADAAWIDPSRRSGGRSERWQEEDLSPGWKTLEELMARYGNMGVKLGPGIPPPEFLDGYEWEYLGLRDECLEAVVWTGQLGRPGTLRATELPQGASVQAFRSDIPDSFGHVSAPGNYLFEPVKAVVRAHLFGVLASQHGLWQIDPRIAYLSGDQPVRTPLLKAYRVLRELPFDRKAIQAYLRQEQVGILEVKKRGVNIIPEEFRAGLKLAGEGKGTLIFTKVMDRKAAFWTQPEP